MPVLGNVRDHHASASRADRARGIPVSFFTTGRLFPKGARPGSVPERQAARGGTTPRNVRRCADRSRTRGLEIRNSRTLLRRSLGEADQGRLLAARSTRAEGPERAAASDPPWASEGRGAGITSARSAQDHSRGNEALHDVRSRRAQPPSTEEGSDQRAALVRVCALLTKGLRGDISTDKD
jgi:hypothetical protein